MRPELPADAKIRILYVEDDQQDADLTQQWLMNTKPQFTLETVATLSAAKDRLNGGGAASYDLVLADLWLPDGDGTSLLVHIRECSLPVAVVLITGVGNCEMAVALLKAGADDYLIKGKNHLERLPGILEGALLRYRAQPPHLSRPLKVLYAEPDFIERDRVRRHLSRYAPHLHLDPPELEAGRLQQLLQSNEVREYDMIILDHHWPGLDSIGIVRELLQERGLEIPVVMVGNHSDEETALQAIKLGVASYVIKTPGYLNRLPIELENAYYRVKLRDRELALQQSRQLLQRIEMVMPAISYLFDVIEKRNVHVNGEIERILGYPPAMIQGLGESLFVALIYPKDRLRFVKYLKRLSLLADGEKIEIEVRMRHADGSYRWLRSRSLVFERTTEGQVRTVIGISEDITLFKQAEMGQRASEKRYRTLFEKAHDAILIQGENDEILEVNQRACELLGYAREELLAMNLNELQPAGQLRRAQGVALGALAEYQDASFETTLVHSTGRRIAVEISHTVIEDAEKLLVLSIIRDLGERQRQKQTHAAIETRPEPNNFAQIIGESAAIREVIRAAKKIAAGEVSPILITGETGTGKGVIARIIHEASRRTSFPFIMIDCTSVPETLFESELFGYEQGAFTDAKKSRRGRLELARGGTLFLDEIGEIPLPLQAKLLQVIQEGVFLRLGGREEIALNARIIAATNRDLRTEVAAGRFRADLYQRLFVVQIEMPPLRDRGDDILRLTEHFIEAYNKKHGKSINRISPLAIKALQRYAWPGNVRELEHAIERAVFFEEDDEITLQHLRLDPNAAAPTAAGSGPLATADRNAPAPTKDQPAGDTLSQISVTIIKQMVEMCGGNIAKAARRLGISRSRIYRALREEVNAAP
ncbi:MAG TPA: sigma 54-interacting transcriptional regulator [Blastocatellia bacterium]|nr:sigma 54-interacting transcriptional regulator [Blastocatellia bacterium]